MSTIILIIPGTDEGLNWWGIAALILVGLLAVYMGFLMWINRG